MGIYCQICDRVGTPEDTQAIKGVVAHTSCFPASWVEEAEAHTEFIVAARRRPARW